MPKFSIILPIYNVEKYLSYCLDSVRKQSFEDIEILCVLDGSKDRSSRIASMHAALDSRIRVIEKENGGLSSARNAGILAATGEYLLFVDSDDYLEKNACKTLLAAFEDHDADVVTFGANCVPVCNANPWLLDCLSPSDAVYDGFDPDILFKEKSRPYVWRTAVRRELLIQHDLLFDEGIAFGEDQVFHFELYPLSKKTVFLSDKLYSYRVDREGSLMHEYAEELQVRVREHLKIVEAILAKWEKRGFSSLCPAELLDWTLDFLYIDIRNAPASTRGEAFQKLGSLIAPALFEAARGALSPICASIIDAAMKGDCSLLASKASIMRYCSFRMGVVPYVKSILVKPLAKLKSVLKKALPLPASSMQICLDQLAEKQKIEQDLCASLQLLEIEARER